jgi:hypothetical protein
MSDLEKATAVVAGLEEKRAACIKHGADLADERSNVALAAHTGDAKARKRLDEINSALAMHASELASIDVALRSAGEQVVSAERAKAREERRAEIKRLQEHSKNVRQLGPFMDKGLANLRDGLIALGKNAGGIGRNHQQVATLIRVLQVAFFDTPFRHEIGVPDSPARRDFSNFSAVINGWCDGRDRELARELASLGGKQVEQVKEKENAA